MQGDWHGLMWTAVGAVNWYRHLPPRAPRVHKLALSSCTWARTQPRRSFCGTGVLSPSRSKTSTLSHLRQSTCLRPFAVWPPVRCGLHALLAPACIRRRAWLWSRRRQRRRGSQRHVQQPRTGARMWRWHTRRREPRPRTLQRDISGPLPARRPYIASPAPCRSRHPPCCCPHAMTRNDSLRRAPGRVMCRRGRRPPRPSTPMRGTRAL